MRKVQQNILYQGVYSDHVIRQRITLIFHQNKYQLTDSYRNDPLKLKELIDSQVREVINFRDNCNDPNKDSRAVKGITDHFDYFVGSNPENSQGRGSVIQLSIEIASEAFKLNPHSFAGLNPILSPKSLSEAHYIFNRPRAKVESHSSYNELGSDFFKKGLEYFNAFNYSGATGQKMILTGDNPNDPEVKKFLDPTKPVVTNTSQPNTHDFFTDRSKITTKEDSKETFLEKAVSKEALTPNITNVGAPPVSDFNRAHAKYISALRIDVKKSNSQIRHIDNKNLNDKTMELNDLLKL